jgi:DNA-binding IclR family transcriptional regulator
MAEPRGAAGRLAYLLKLIAEGPCTFTLKDLTARSALPSSTVHRLLQELVRSSLIERSAGQGYRPGRELYLLASRLVAKFEFVRCSRPYIEQLEQAWQETVVLCAYSPAGRNAAIADVVPTPHPLRYAIEVGDVIELPWGSLGKAILASLPAEHRVVLLREQMVGPISGRPLPPVSEMEANLAAIRTQGWSLHYDEENDLAGIAAPIFGPGDAILGCVGVTMPARRFGFHDEAALSKAVRDAAIAISEKARIAQS